MENQIASSFDAVFENKACLCKVPAGFRDVARHTVRITIRI